MRTLLRASCCLGFWLLGCLAIYVPDDQSPPAYCTVFGHIMKCGGSTIKWALDTAQPPELPQPGVCVFAVYGTDRCRNVSKNSAVIEGYSELVRGRLEKAGRHDCSFFTMMRHPVDRLLSQFFYCPNDHDIQHRPAKWCGEVEDEEPLSERLVQFATHHWGNHALKMMLFGRTCPPQWGCTPDQIHPSFKLESKEDWERLETAKALLGTYDAVGILEHWPLSMELFDRKIKSPVKRWSDIDYVVNVGTESTRRQELLRWAYKSEKIRSIVEGDLLLYEHGLSIFKRQTADALGTVWDE